MDQTEKLLLEQFNKYPKLQIQDIFKFIYQSSFGCEHMVASLEKATDYIKEEYNNGITQNEVEELDGDYCRVPLSYIDKGLKFETFGKLFYLSAKKEEGLKNLLKKIEITKKLINENKLPFNIEDFNKSVEAWEAQGYPAIHHSKEFRENYKPAYRLISKKYIPFLPLFIEIDKGRTKIAIEGGSGSGKSTLTRIIADVYICTVLHMDDFFLQSHQRTPERLEEIGGNFDRERFLREVLIPLSKGEAILYKTFDCHTMTIQEGKKIEPQNFTVIEGAYSMHPDLASFYDFSVFLDISPETQRERILNRNGNDFAQRFFSEWIPLENKYFSHFNIKEKCDMIITIK